MYKFLFVYSINSEYYANYLAQNSTAMVPKNVGGVSEGDGGRTRKLTCG